MRILFIATVFPPAFLYGGPPRATLSTAKSLMHVGHDVLVLTTDASPSGRLDMPYSEETSYEGVSVIYFRHHLYKPFFYSPELKSAISKLAPEFDICLVKGHWTYINFAASSLLSSIHKPFCLYPEGTLDPWAFRYRGLKKRMYWELVEKRNYHRANGFIAASVNEEQQLRAHGLVQPITVVPNAVALSEFDQSTTVYADQFRSDFSGREVVLFLSRLHPKKGLDLLLLAFSRLHKKHPNALLVVIGSGKPSYESHIQEMARDLDIRNDVLFLGTVFGERMIALLRYADVFVLPSYSEGLPMAVQNALACGTPVIISRFCNMPEVADYQAGAVLEDLQDINELSDSIFQILADKELRQTMGTNAIRLVSDVYSYQAVGQKTADFCKDIVAASRTTL